MKSVTLAEFVAAMYIIATLVWLATTIKPTGIEAMIPTDAEIAADPRSIIPESPPLPLQPGEVRP